MSHARPTRFCYRGERGECESKRERSPAGDRRSSARGSIDRVDGGVSFSATFATLRRERVSSEACRGRDARTESQYFQTTVVERSARSRRRPARVHLRGILHRERIPNEARAGRSKEEVKSEGHSRGESIRFSRREREREAVQQRTGSRGRKGERQTSSLSRVESRNRKGSGWRTEDRRGHCATRRNGGENCTSTVASPRF